MKKMALRLLCALVICAQVFAFAAIPGYATAQDNAHDDYTCSSQRIVCDGTDEYT